MATAAAATTTNDFTRKKIIKIHIHLGYIMKVICRIKQRYDKTILKPKKSNMKHEQTNK